MSSFCFYDKLDVDKLQFIEAISGEAAYLLPGGRYMERYESARQTEIFYAFGAVVSVGVVAEVPVLGILKPCTLPLAAVSVTSPPMISFLWTKSVA